MTPWEEHSEWVEKDLFFDFSRAQYAFKLDDSNHGLSHCLKSVDFVVEWTNQLWLVEAKDPEDGKIPEQHRQHQKEQFLNDLSSRVLIAKHLFPKFRDSLIYLGLNQGIVTKPMRYISLIGLNTLDSAQLNGLKDSVWEHEWMSGPKKGWKKSFDVQVFNVEQWNRLLPQCPITRISEQ